MEELLMEELLWGTLRGTDTLDITLKLFLCIVCGGLIGLERGAKGQAAGFRTHILVCMGACIAMLTGQYIYEYFETNSDPARLGAQVISGIGFLGAGTIMSRETTRVRGLTTAAGLWAAACIGLAVGIGFFEAAIGATVVVMVTIVIFQRVDNFFYTRSPILRVYLEMESIDYVKGLIRTIRMNGMRVSGMELQKPRSGMQNAVGIALVVKKNTRRNPVDMLEVISKVEGVTFIEETL